MLSKVDILCKKLRFFTNNITKQLYNIIIMIELTTRQERELWNHYTRLLKEHSSRKIKNKYFQKRRMDDWEKEYKQLEIDRREKVRELNKEVVLKNKKEKEEQEMERQEQEMERQEQEKNNKIKYDKMILKRKQTIEAKKVAHPVRRSRRLNKDVMDASAGLLLLKWRAIHGPKGDPLSSLNCSHTLIKKNVITTNTGDFRCESRRIWFFF